MEDCGSEGAYAAKTDVYIPMKYYDNTGDSQLIHYEFVELTNGYAKYKNISQ